MTAQEDLTAFETQMATVGYELGDIMGTPELDSLEFMKLRAKAAQELNKINTFNEAKQAAFDELALSHNDERITLGAIWQTKEDNDYEL